MTTDFKGSSTEVGDEDCIRFNNCLQRDFTINGLMFDSYAKVVYDYLEGIEDIRKAKVRTMVHAGTFFSTDCARILRAIRIAARLGFRMSKETAHFIKNLSFLVQRLDKVFIPLQLYLRAGRIFQCVRREETQMGFEAKQGSKIEYGLLYSGDFPEIRHVFARVVFDTVFPLNLSQEF